METLLIITLATFSALLPFWLGQRWGLIRWVSPLHLVAYFCFFGFFLKVTAYSVWPDLAFYRRFVENPWGDQLGAIYLALFVFALCAGYRLACTDVPVADMSVLRQSAAGLSRRNTLFALAFAMTFATVVLILRQRGAIALDADTLAALNSAKQININENGVGATLAGLKTFFIVPKCAFVLLCAHALATRSAVSAAQTVALGILLVGVAIVSGDRFELVELAIYAVAIWALFGGVIRAQTLITVGMAIAAIGVVSAYMTGLRLGENADGTPLRQIVGSTYFLDINAAIMVTDRVNTPDMLMGQSYVWWTFGWVPRAFWPDKPAIDLGVFFKRDIMGIYTGGAYNVTGPGEAFINFGWGGLAVAAALGWIYRKGEAFLLSAYAVLRHGTFILYPLIFYPFVQATLQSSFSAFIVGTVAQMIVLIAMIAFFLIRYQPTFSAKRGVYAY